MRLNANLLTAVFASLIISACASSPDKADDSAAADSQDSASSGLQTQGADRARAGDPQTLQAQRDAELRRQTVIYFDFDSSEFGSEYDGMLDAHARYLVRNPSARLRLEGHTDERGSREYNVSLGERRALSVRRALLLRGAAKGQLSTTSYGEERPVSQGTGEAAWRRNRRVELSYQ